MALESPMSISVAHIISPSPTNSRSSSLAGRPRKPSPLRRSSTPEDSEQLVTPPTQQSEEDLGKNSEAKDEPDFVGSLGSQVDSGDENAQARRASEGTAIPRQSTEESGFTKSSASKSASNLSGWTTNSTVLEPLSSQISGVKASANSKYSLPPIKPTPKFPHSAPIRPLRPLTSVGGSGAGSPTSVPHAGAGISGRAPQRQKIIVPSKSWKACFDLNLTAKELARFD